MLGSGQRLSIKESSGLKGQKHIPESTSEKKHTTHTCKHIYQLIILLSTVTLLKSSWFKMQDHNSHCILQLFKGIQKKVLFITLFFTLSFKIIETRVLIHTDYMPDTALDPSECSGGEKWTLPSPHRV